MSGRKNHRAQGRLSNASATLVVVGLLVVATVAPLVGTAIASPAGPTTGGTATDAVRILPNPLNPTDNETAEAASEKRPKTVDIPTTPDVPTTTVVPTTDETSTTTEESTSTTVVTTTHPGKGNGPPEDVPGANQTPNPGPPGNGPPNGTGPPGKDEDSSANQTPTSGPPEAPGEGPPADAPGRPSDPGESANWSGPPNRTGPPSRPDAPNRTGASNQTGPPNRTGPPNETARDPQPPNDVERVNATVENATANESVSVNVSRPGAQDDEVSFSSISVTPTRNANFTLNVTASEEPIAEKTPSVELSNGTRPLAYLSVDHSIGDENISNVTFSFRVRRDRVNHSERDEIVLYRFHDATWNELPTTLVETTAAHYVYRVRSPGLSEFAAGKQTAQFEITAASVDVRTLSVGDALKVRVRITNHGKADGTFTADLVLGNHPVAQRRLTIASGGMRQTTFDRTVARPGTYEVWINDYKVGEVTVNGTEATDDGATERASSDPDPEKSDATETDADHAGQGTNANVSGFGVGGALGALFAGVVGLVAVVRRRR